MSLPDADASRTLNAVIVGISAVIGIAMLFPALRRTNAEDRARRYALRIDLPIGSDAVLTALSTRLRVSAVADALALLAATLASAVLLVTPLALNSFFVVAVMVPLFVASSAVATVAVSVRERLFHPLPTAPRIARARTASLAEYVPGSRLIAPWVLAGAAAIALALVLLAQRSAPTAIETPTLASALITAAVALAAFAVVPLLARAVLAQPQPASHSLELAWDDALRAQTLASLLCLAAMAGWFALSTSLIALSEASGASWATVATALPGLGVAALSILFSPRPLPAALRPAWMRTEFTETPT